MKLNSDLRLLIFSILVLVVFVASMALMEYHLRDDMTRAYLEYEIPALKMAMPIGQAKLLFNFVADEVRTGNKGVFPKYIAWYDLRDMQHGRIRLFAKQKASLYLQLMKLYGFDLATDQSDYTANLIYCATGHPYCMESRL